MSTSVALLIIGQFMWLIYLSISLDTAHFRIDELQGIKHDPWYVRLYRWLAFKHI